MITFDTSNTFTGNGNYTCSAINGILVVSSNILQGPTASGYPGMTGITYNGIALTRLTNRVYVGISPQWIEEFWYLLNPPSGTHTLAFSGDIARGLWVAASYNNVLQTSFPDSSNSNGSASNVTSLALSDTVIADNCWLIATGGASGDQSPFWSTVTGGVQRNGIVNPGDSYCFIDDSNGPVSAGSQSLTFTNIGIGSPVGGIIAAIAPGPVSGNGLFMVSD